LQHLWIAQPNIALRERDLDPLNLEPCSNRMIEVRLHCQHPIDIAQDRADLEIKSYAGIWVMA